MPILNKFKTNQYIFFHFSFFRDIIYKSEGFVIMSVYLTSSKKFTKKNLIKFLSNILGI